LKCEHVFDLHAWFEFGLCVLVCCDPVQWLRQCLGVCHGASDISEPIRGVGSPQHLRGERTVAAPAPRALTRIGFITIPRKALRGTA
jgi:hypothetical protein